MMSSSEDSQKKLDRGEYIDVLEFCVLPQNKDAWDADDFTELRIRWLKFNSTQRKKKHAPKP